jgi:hypothetical protein
MPQSADDFHRRMGMVAATMMKTSEYCQFPIACLAVWIEPAILRPNGSWTARVPVSQLDNLPWLKLPGMVCEFGAGGQFMTGAAIPVG